MKRFLLVSFFGVMIFASICNLTSFQRSIIFRDGGREFNIAKFVELNRFDESAPVVLSNHFATVTVKRLGDPEKTGISFSKELSRIFKVRNLTFDEPIDVRGQPTVADLLRFTKETLKARCAAAESEGLCTVSLAWDTRHSQRNRIFIALRTGDSAYAIIDSFLAESIFGVTSW